MEVILSFVLFVSIVFVALLFFTPAKTTRVLESSLSFIEREIVENTTTVLVTYSVKIDQSADDIVVVEISEDANKKVRVEDYQGIKLPSSHSSGKIYFERDSEDFVLIKFSEDFPETNEVPTSSNLDPNLYDIVSSSSESILSEKRVISLQSSYTNNYNVLRESFNLRNIDFSFSVTIPGKEAITAEIQIPENVDIFAKSRKIQILLEDGSTAFGDLRTKVW